MSRDLIDSALLLPEDSPPDTPSTLFCQLHWLRPLSTLNYPAEYLHTSYAVVTAPLLSHEQWTGALWHCLVYFHLTFSALLLVFSPTASSSFVQLHCAMSCFLTFQDTCFWAVPRPEHWLSYESILVISSSVILALSCVPVFEGTIKDPVNSHLPPPAPLIKCYFEVIFLNDADFYLHLLQRPRKQELGRFTLVISQAMSKHICFHREKQFQEVTH